MTDLEKLKALRDAGEKAERCIGKNPRICWAIPCNLGKECKQKARYKMDAWHNRQNLPAIIEKYERMEEALRKIESEAEKTLHDGLLPIRATYIGRAADMADAKVRLLKDIASKALAKQALEKG